MSVEFKYDIAPPPGVEPVIGGKPAPLSEHKVFAVDQSGVGGAGNGAAAGTPGHGPVKTYYDAASKAVRQAQDELNDTFTVWKDAIGDLEKHKEQSVAPTGMGKAARMMAANKAAEAALDAEDEESEDEDGVDLAEAGWVRKSAR